MPRANLTYSLPLGGGATATQVTSTGTADVKTITPPLSAGNAPTSTACFVCATTTNVRMTFDGTTPDGTHGITIIKGAQPLFIPFAGTIKFASETAGNGLVDVFWLA